MHPFLDDPESLQLPRPHWMCRFFGWHKWVFRSVWTIKIDDELVIFCEYWCSREGCGSFRTERNPIDAP